YVTPKGFRLTPLICPNALASLPLSCWASLSLPSCTAWKARRHGVWRRLFQPFSGWESLFASGGGTSTEFPEQPNGPFATPDRLCSLTSGATLIGHFMSGLRWRQWV